MLCVDSVNHNPEMETYLTRLATFNSLPESAKYSVSLSPPRLSNAGFYYPGDGETVTCYSCGLYVHMETGNDPMILHTQRSPMCQFVVEQRTDNVSVAVPMGEVSEQASGAQVAARVCVVSQSTQVSPHRSQRERRRRHNSLTSSTAARNRHSHISSLVNSSGNVDRFTSRDMKERINNNDQALMEEMICERRRLVTYANWPRDTNIEPEALAQAGLFYLYRADRVKCAFCYGILRNWEPFEEPMRKHRRLFPRCPFLRDPRAAGNVALGEEPPEEQTLDVHHRESLDVYCGDACHKYPTREFVEDRRNTFNSWPSNNPLSPDRLAHAGFYYTGVSDDVCCYFCGGHLNGWHADDDPMTEHHRRFPDCGFLRMPPGRELTSQFQSSHEDHRHRT